MNRFREEVCGPQPARGPIHTPRLTPSLDKYAIVRLMVAGAVVRRELERALRINRTPLREVMVVATVADFPRITSSAVADRLGIHRSEVSRRLPVLVEDNLLEWPEGAADRRRLALRAGPAAPAFVRAAAPALAAIDQRLLRSLTPPRRKHLAACLEQLRVPRSLIGETIAEIDGRGVWPY